MTDLNSIQNQASSEDSQKPVTPIRCISGAAVSGAIATALYFLSASIIDTFAHKPIHSHKVVTLNIAAAVRTLVMGMSIMATAIFAIATLGLLALAIQLSLKGLTNSPASPSK